MNQSNVSQATVDSTVPTAARRGERKSVAAKQVAEASRRFAEPSAIQVGVIGYGGQFSVTVHAMWRTEVE